MECKNKHRLGVTKRIADGLSQKTEAQMKCENTPWNFESVAAILGHPIKRPMLTWGQVLTSLILERLEVEKFSESGKLWFFWKPSWTRWGEQFTFTFPSAFVFPFGGSMITRVSIDPPSMAHRHRGEVCKKLISFVAKLTRKVVPGQYWQADPTFPQSHKCCSLSFFFLN